MPGGKQMAREIDFDFDFDDLETEVQLLGAGWGLVVGQPAWAFNPQLTIINTTT